MAASAGDKTEKATPQRLREARRRGETPTSPDFAGGALALIMLIVLQQQGGHIFGGLLALLTADLAAAANPGVISEATIGARVRTDMLAGLSLLIPLAIAVVVGAIVIGALNTRGLVSLKGAAPSLRKLNVLSNAKHLVGKEALIMLLKAIVKVAVAVLVVFSWSPAWRALLPALAFTSISMGASVVWGDVMQVLIQISAIYFILGLADLGYRYFAYYRRMRMTKQEIKEEAKSMEGNPQMRARMRQQGRRRLRSLMSGGGIRKVPQADVIITNPTHFAVAIQYAVGKMRAPKVIAKGQNLVALRIRQTAQAHNIPIVENKPLAQALYKSVEVNREIPAELYQAVAQVLAFVYRVKRPKRSAGSSQRSAISSQLHRGRVWEAGHERRIYWERRRSQ